MASIFSPPPPPPSSPPHSSLWYSTKRTRSHPVAEHRQIHGDSKNKGRQKKPRSKDVKVIRLGDLWLRRRHRFGRRRAALPNSVYGASSSAASISELSSLLLSHSVSHSWNRTRTEGSLVNCSLTSSFARGIHCHRIACLSSFLSLRSPAAANAICPSSFSGANAHASIIKGSFVAAPALPLVMCQSLGGPRNGEP